MYVSWQDKVSQQISTIKLFTFTINTIVILLSFVACRATLYFFYKTDTLICVAFANFASTRRATLFLPCAYPLTLPPPQGTPLQRSHAQTTNLMFEHVPHSQFESFLATAPIRVLVKPGQSFPSNSQP